MPSFVSVLTRNEDYFTGFQSAVTMFHPVVRVHSTYDIGYQPLGHGLFASLSPGKHVCGPFSLVDLDDEDWVRQHETA